MSQEEKTTTGTKKRFTYTEEDHRAGRSLPIGLWIMHKCFGVNFYRRNKWMAFISMLFLTFICYMSYHATRKVFSVTKGQLSGKAVTCGNCSNSGGWAPFNSSNSKMVLSSLDSTLQFAYAAAMYGVGPLADKTSHKWVMVIGCILSGMVTILFGLGNFLNIHHIAYYIFLQILGGVTQSMGFACAVSIVQKFFNGHAYRALIFGVWNANPFVGNILGNLIPSAFFDKSWGLSFIVPGCFSIGVAIIVGLFLIPSPEIVGFTDFQKKVEDEDDLNKPLLRDSNEESKTPVLETETQELIEDSQVEKKVEGRSNPFKLLLIPGVMEYACSLFFGKMVIYVFFFWLPLYLEETEIKDYVKTAKTAAFASSMLEVGQILGGLGSGFLADMTKLPGMVCVVMQILCGGTLYLYQLFGQQSIYHTVFLLILAGFFVNGGPALIATSVSASLSNNKSLSSRKAVATVSSIINATGSLGSAIGPIIMGYVVEKYTWKYLMPSLIVAISMATLFLARQFYNEARTIPQKIRDRKAACAAAKGH